MTGLVLSQRSLDANGAISPYEMEGPRNDLVRRNLQYITADLIRVTVDEFFERNVMGRV